MPAQSPQVLTPLDPALVDAVVRGALLEDTGSGDLTAAVVPAGTRARARLVARQPGVLAGLGVFLRTFELCDASAAARTWRADGDRVEAHEEGADPVATVEGDARALLVAERTALNFLQRMSGIATLTARYVEIARAAGPVRILDTRKTTPGLRAFEKYAVRCGGGENHRFGLWDQAMMKDNHIDLAGCGLQEAVERLRRHVGEETRITAEARSADEARGAVLGGADVVLLDNMTPEAIAGLCGRLRKLAAERGRPLEIEASGSVDERELSRYAASGVDRISVGRLTHSAPALDFSLYMEPAS